MGWLSELRRRWVLASMAALCVLTPVAAYALLAVPTYTSVGVIQVSSHGAAINPLLDLMGTPSPSEVETEIEIIQRRDFVLGVLEDLRLHLVDPHQPHWITSDTDVALGGKSPVREALRVARDAVEQLDVSPRWHAMVPLQVTGLPHQRLAVRVGSAASARTYEVGLGEPVEDEAVTLRFGAMPVAEGEVLELAVLSDGIMVDTLARRLRVTAVGGSRAATNLVRIEFTDPDRETAQAVVQGLMQQYLDQSLRWQSLSASNSADFIARRLEEAREQLAERERALRGFAEEERAVKLDTQAEVTIRASAELEAQKRMVELQERVIGTVRSDLERSRSGHANLTSNFFDDPVLAAAVGALTEAEIQHEILRGTLTDDHPRVVALGQQITRQQAEVRRLLRSAQKNLTEQRKELDGRIEQSMQSLAAYPAKELQLARYMRDVEVSQKLYFFLLEKYQEAQIVEASTTIDKRIVDAAALPHRRTSPWRGRLAATGLIGAFAFTVVVVYLARLMQRRLPTVEAIKEKIPYPVHGAVPFIGVGGAMRRRRGGAASWSSRVVAWSDPADPAAESFRALAVNMSLTPVGAGRGRIIQITSCQPEEGKSTVASNLAVALSSSGARVLLIDLDLRRPTQHRIWKIRRVPGYGDLAGQGGGPERAHALLQHDGRHDLDILSAGIKLPDPLSALMSPALPRLLTHWSTHYDYVIVDSPPVFVPGTAVIARHADIVTLVAQPGVTERLAAQRTIESLSRLGAYKALVLNGIELKHADSYSYYRESYAYVPHSTGA